MMTTYPVRMRGTSPVIGAFAGILLALALLASTMSSVGLAGLPAGPAPIRTSAAPQPRDLTFYMHNTTLGQNVNGVTTPFLFDTLQKFGGNNTVSKVQTVRQDWRLYPVLAGPLALNGTVTLHVFVSIDLAGAQITPTLDLSEINATGSTVWTYTLTTGSQAGWTTPHDLVLTTPTLRHTFAAGSTLLVVVTITSGVRIATIWYNASWVPTHLVLQSDDFARIHDLAFLDPAGTPRFNFDPLAANTTIRIDANVTDPLGGYDIHWVNLTVTQPGGTIVLDDVPMAKVSGTPIAFASLFQVAWNYSGHPTGRYNASASVVDQSGHYYFESAFTTAGFLDLMEGFFYIGGLPIYVNVEAVDSKSVALAGAQIVLVSGGVAVDTKATDPNGMANFTMAKGPYLLQVWWQAIRVASQALNATSNVSAADPLVVSTTVYYPVFQAQDADGKPLADASIVLTHPNGTKLGPFRTNASGDMTLSQMAGGSYRLEVSWRGVDVFTGDEAVASNGVIAFEARVYELTVTAKAGSGETLAGVFVSVVDSTGLVFDAGVTGSDGTVVLRLPAGSYTIDARYITEQMGTLYDSGVRSQNVTLTSSSSATVTFSDFPLPLTSTFVFLIGLGYALTVAALLVVFLLLWHRRSPKAEKQPEVPQKPA